MKIILIRHAANNSDIVPMKVAGHGFRLYSSPEDTARMTADAMWNGEDYEVTELLSALSEEESSDRRLAKDRASAFLDAAEREGGNIAAISHESFLRFLYKELRRRQYRVKRTNLFKIDYLEKAVAAKARDHCGCCSQNCLLENPGCNIGRDMARRERL